MSLYGSTAQHTMLEVCKQITLRTLEHCFELGLASTPPEVCEEHIASTGMLGKIHKQYEFAIELFRSLQFTMSRYVRLGFISEAKLKFEPALKSK